MVGGLYFGWYFLLFLYFFSIVIWRVFFSSLVFFSFLFSAHFHPHNIFYAMYLFICFCINISMFACTAFMCAYHTYKYIRGWRNRRERESERNLILVFFFFSVRMNDSKAWTWEMVINISSPISIEINIDIHLSIYIFLMVMYDWCSMYEGVTLIIDILFCCIFWFT